MGPVKFPPFISHAQYYLLNYYMALNLYFPVSCYQVSKLCMLAIPLSRSCINNGPRENNWNFPVKDSQSVGPHTHTYIHAVVFTFGR